MARKMYPGEGMFKDVWLRSDWARIKEGTPGRKDWVTKVDFKGAARLDPDAVQAGVLEGSVEQFDVFSVMEAAMIRGVSSGPRSRSSQNKRKGAPKRRRKRAAKLRRKLLA